jgi:hypothetical protein
MLQEMEETFKEIDALQGDTARPLEEEERLFLEAIRGLNQEASSMQREEKADLGHASSTSDQEHSADDQPAAKDAATAAGTAKRPAATEPAAVVVPEGSGGGGTEAEAGGAGGTETSGETAGSTSQTAPLEEKVEAEAEGGESAGKRRRL